MPISYFSLPGSYLTPITEADIPSNTYTTYDEEMVKGARVIEIGNAANAT